MGTCLEGNELHKVSLNEQPGSQLVPNQQKCESQAKKKAECLESRGTCLNANMAQNGVLRSTHFNKRATSGNRQQVTVPDEVLQSMIEKSLYATSPQERGSKESIQKETNHRTSLTLLAGPDKVYKAQLPVPVTLNLSDQQKYGQPHQCSAIHKQSQRRSNKRSAVMKRYTFICGTQEVHLRSKSYCTVRWYRCC